MEYKSLYITEESAKKFIIDNINKLDYYCLGNIMDICLADYVDKTYIVREKNVVCKHENFLENIRM